MHIVKSIALIMIKILAIIYISVLLKMAIGKEIGNIKISKTLLIALNINPKKALLIKPKNNYLTHSLKME